MPRTVNDVCLLASRFLVFHGGSGSSKEEIQTAVGHGVVKMNVDTDTQFAYMAGIRVRRISFFFTFIQLNID